MKEFNRTVESVQTDVPTVQPIFITSGGTAIVVIAMLLLTIIIIYITSQNADSAPYGIVGSVLFFLFGTPIGLLAVNGGLADMFRSYQEQRTIRRFNDQQAAYNAHAMLQVVPPAQLSYSTPVDPPRLDSFVPAVPRISEAVKVDAANFVTQLFDTTNGRPLPNRITRNKLQIQWKSPSPEAVEYLISLGIVSAPEGKQLYWSPHYPTLRDAINSIRTGIRRPSLEEGSQEGRVGLRVGEVAS